MHWTKQELEGVEKIRRLNIINSITGIKPANLIGTVSDAGELNLAIFSSIVHLGSNPALLGFVSRPSEEVPRHTLENIQQNGSYTINHVHESFVEKAHYTSAKFTRETSEFEQCKLTPEFLPAFKAPFVKESQIRMGMKFLEAIPININKTILIIGEIQHLIVPDEVLSEEGYVDLADANSIGISGLNTYYSFKKIGTFSYARTQELPEF